MKTNSDLTEDKFTNIFTNYTDIQITYVGRLNKKRSPFMTLLYFIV